MATVPGSNVGSATNGRTYRGRRITSGYDCELRRVSATAVLACMISAATRREWIAELEVAPDADLQALAVQLAASPPASLSDPDIWVADRTERFDALVLRWNAAIDAAEED